jgi:UDP-N-acetylmuramate dehydrogenase
VNSARLSAEKEQSLRNAFPEGLEQNAELARFTSARIGGPADFLLTVKSSDQLESAARRLWEIEAPFRILGGGTNLLVADRGARGVVIMNQAREVEFHEQSEAPYVRAESGASFGALGRRAVDRGLGGLEWVVTVPGTVGGAIVGNAGAHGSDVASCLKVAEILHRDGRAVHSPADELDYGYRDSWFKRNPGEAIVLAGSFALDRTPAEDARSKMNAFIDHRQSTQPGGASMGSMFKNPEGDHAGRLIEAAGCKGLTRGKAQISDLHANFFLNQGAAKASDVLDLIQLAREEVKRQFGVDLELEIELFGDWGEDFNLAEDNA